MIDMGQLHASQVHSALLLAALLVVAVPSRAVDSDLYLAGLGLHQETGRNIYLGGIYLEREAPKPVNFTQAAGARIMEYRVVARRTSIRSLLGGMLLQSEVATGSPPDRATADFADAILSAVNTSLYAGDSLEVRLNENNETVALLNGHELARIKDKSVADYLLMGWVGESGPSTSFRNELTAARVNPSLLSALEANTYSPQREAEIASWLAGGEDAGEMLGLEPAEVDATASTIDIDAPGLPSAVADTAEGLQAPDTDTAGAEWAIADTAAEVQAPGTDIVASAGPGAVLPANAAAPNEQPVGPLEEELAGVATLLPRLDAAPAETGLATAGVLEDVLQVASLLPTPEMLPGNPLEQEIQALGIQEYSQRLNAFHKQLVRMVYSEIRYPKRAVRRNLEGRLELDVTMTAEGEVLSIQVALPSGHGLLDEAA
ncbi:MAG: TonB family protein, partial [Halioglobus sp.]|nr:TonB family protein [Halioglobus sp.]